MTPNELRVQSLHDLRRMAKARGLPHDPSINKSRYVAMLADATTQKDVPEENPLSEEVE